MDENALDRSAIPPQSTEAEQSVLGSLLIDNEAVDSVLGLISSSDFYLRSHQMIFEAMVRLASERQPVDVITVSEQLERTKHLQDVGGSAYLVDLTQIALSAANIHHYATIVRERALTRALIAVGLKISKMGYNPNGRSVRELTEEAEQSIFELANKHMRTSTFRLTAEVLRDVVDTVTELGETSGDITGVSTGFNQLDSMTSGLQNGDLIILAGRPSMGKTTLAMNFVEHAARYHTIKTSDQTPLPASIGVFSMEMSDEQLVMRLVSSVGNIPLGNIRTGQLSSDEYSSFFAACDTLRALNIHIDHSSGLTAFELRARARRLKAAHPTLSLIVVDYLQLLNGDSKNENRVAEITQISRLLKEMARELEIPVVVLSQLNRSVEKRDNKRPYMSDLRESGSIEQDADIIMFVHREEVFSPDKPEVKGKASLIVAKQRNGDTGDIALRFEGKFSKFSNPIHNPDAPLAGSKDDYYPADL